MSSPSTHLSAGRQSWIATLMLAIVALGFAYPFVWMALAVFKSNPEIFNPQTLLPETWDLEPVRRLWSGEWFPFWRVFGNSLIVAFSQAVLATLVTSLAGHVFAESRRTGIRWLLPVAMVVVVVPAQSLAVPLFTWTNSLGLLDRLPGVILPGAVSGIGIIWFTQVFRRVPTGLKEAARLDGAGELRIWWMLLPVLAPALISFGLIHFILAWHQHLLPLLVLSQTGNQTLPVAIASLYGSSLRYPYAALMAASLLSVLPTLTLFVACQRKFRTALADVLMH